LKTKQIVLITLLLGIPIVLLILPADFFDDGQSICLSRLIFDVECYGCGLTRSIMHLIHFDIQTSWEWNKLGVISFPILFLLWLKYLLKQFNIIVFKWL